MIKAESFHNLNSLSYLKRFLAVGHILVLGGVCDSLQHVSRVCVRLHCLRSEIV